MLQTTTGSEDFEPIRFRRPCLHSDAWIDRFAQKAVRSLQVENTNCSTQQLADQFCLRLVEFLLGTSIDVDPPSRHDLRVVLRSNHAHGPAVYTRSSAIIDHSWEPDATSEDRKDDESDASELDSIVSQFDRESDSDYDPDDDFEDALSDASSGLSDYESCLETTSDLEWDEYSDTGGDEDVDEDDSLAIHYTSCCQRKYQAVRAVFMIWDFPGFVHLPHAPYTVEQEMEDPMNSFTAYNYEVEQFTIPSHNPTIRLLEKIRECKTLLKAGNTETLLILWYNGHGNVEGVRNDLVLYG
ncbi:homeobox domain containing protein [Colletotrichum asianum]